MLLPTPEQCGYNKRYKHVVDTGHLGLGHNYVQYMAETCQSGWGWFWSEDSLTCKVSFEDEQEAFMFSLQYDFTEKDKLKDD